MKVLTLDDAREIIGGYAGTVPEATLVLAAAILRQHRVMLVQAPGVTEYREVVTGYKRLEAVPNV